MVRPSEPPNRIVEFYNDKTLLITGGSGFLGKVLIEKLLRCTEVKKIFVIVRAKKGKTPQERVNEIVNGVLFDLVRKQRGAQIFDKIKAVAGDVRAEGLGLSEVDRKKIASETQIIFHSAATVKFDEVFREAVLLNVRGTKLMLHLAKECKNLEAFCYVSTAYCHEDEEVLEEKTYPCRVDPLRVIEICEWMEDDLLATIHKKIRGFHANTYTFTKALAEALIEAQMANLPLMIVRPSAVLPIWKEPLPGWTDNVNGPMGLLIGAGKGVIRTMYGSGDNFADYVPVDIIANGLIASPWDYVTNKTRRVFNLTSSDETKITFQEIIDLGKSIITEDIPLNTMLWYPGGSIKQSRFLHYIALVLTQLLPALLIDGILFLCGIKPFLLRIQKRIIKGYEVFEYYSNRKWNFTKKNGILVRNNFNSSERQMFKMDPDGMVYKNYICDCLMGARRYILNESDDTLPLARKRMKIMKTADTVMKIVLTTLFFYFLFKAFFY